jgi:hypothetical protein
MAWWLLTTAWLGGCDTRLPDPDFVSHLEVVTVVADPPEVSPLEPIEVTAWVADAWERGADVLIWPCTPVEIGERVRCGEGLDINGRGVRLSYFTEIVSVRDHRAQATLLTPFLPYQVFAEEASDKELSNGLPMPVLALACDPGVCEIFDWVAADPEPGTEAYARAARALADPTQLAKQASQEQMSLAVKLVTVMAPEQERRTNPQLLLATRRGIPEEAAFEWTLDIQPGEQVDPGDDDEPIYGPYGTYYPYEEPDEEPDDKGKTVYSVRIGYTSGRLIEKAFDGTQLRVVWQGEPERDGVMVLGLSDGRGGSAGVAVELPAIEP